MDLRNQMKDYEDKHRLKNDELLREVEFLKKLVQV